MENDKVRTVSLALLLLLCADLGGAQVRRLTPGFAQEILGVARKATAEAHGDSAQAARTFQSAYGEGYLGPNSQSRLCDPEASPDLKVCFYSPAGWYAEQLGAALRRGDDLTSIEARDAFVIVLSPSGDKVPAPNAITLEQGAPYSNGIQRPVKAISPVRTLRMPLERDPMPGSSVVRTVAVFLFDVDAIDFAASTRLMWPSDRTTRVGISAQVMRQFR